MGVSSVGRCAHGCEELHIVLASVHSSKRHSQQQGTSHMGDAEGGGGILKGRGVGARASIAAGR